MSFRDHFSGVSGDYSRYRPRYPQALFDWLAATAPGRGVAWDCATGSGQAAEGLAPLFRRVEATDASEAQIRRAPALPGVRFRVATAEDSGMAEAAADLITVAQALHWFDRDRFFTEAGRVLADDGLLAAWCYELCTVDPDIDALVLEFYRGPLGPWWPPERRHIDAGYGTIGMPWPELETPEFHMEAEWEAGQMLGYLSTWSALARCRKAAGIDPLADIAGRLEALWGPGPRRVRWPLAVRACRRPPRGNSDTDTCMPS
ncbi:class I SAM-dependent methyltransferase [Lentisalinibacter salinarum]|uniref:class I SAM-dependent methyltransferase n=1 Tax=Lentisalinibacter salinarum TaxID=2992239 RepID=UPI00386D0509